MATSILDSDISGAGGGLPPITDERTPDDFGDESDWHKWERQLDPELVASLTPERVKDVGRAVRFIEEQGVPRAAGHIAASAYVMPRVDRIIEVSPGFYRFN